MLQMIKFYQELNSPNKSTGLEISLVKMVILKVFKSLTIMDLKGGSTVTKL